MRMILNLIATLAAANGPSECPFQLERTAALMGTTLRVELCANSAETAARATEAGFAEVRRLERVLSSWSATSEVGVVNGVGAWAGVRVSSELYRLLDEAGVWVGATNGAFDPAVGALIDAWQIRSGGRVPSGDELHAALQRTGWRYLEFCGNDSIKRGPAGWWIDTGGFGKGAALRNLANILKQHGVDRAVIDFGGQLLIVGEAREIAVADPRERERAAMMLRVRDVSVSTSSQSEHKPFGHILDPRNGKPVVAWGSVTVVAADAMTADALSTALFVMGPRAAMEWARNRNDVGVLILENTSEQPRATWNEALSRMLIMENTQ